MGDNRVPNGSSRGCEVSPMSWVRSVNHVGGPDDGILAEPEGAIRH